MNDSAVETPIAVRRFQEIVWPLLPAVLRAARILCRDPNDADDLAQDTMLKAFRAIDTFSDGTNPHAWLMTILRNARLDRLRSARSRAADVSLEALDADLPDPHTESELHWGDDPARTLAAFSDAQVIDALSHLPEEIRLTLLLVDVQSMDHADAARVLDVPVGTIKSRAHRGRAMLREKLLPLARQMKFTGEAS